ncbi:TROVE domain-containing protein [Actinorugispora endophytica]|uniref:TROVE domain-containing protein n=1 Tax=Actinorugispora endophytica TaxID=1605990 RepID=A0A4R6UM30_9ACTN|nr:TROVE domain-containing protein [Actinorugispora endophytica]TDQ46589.1 TROVE domain-containing protein [Actinorugispora endophytica]
MAKFNRATATTTGTAPVTAERVASGRTFEGAPGHRRDARSELFVLAVSNMVGERTAYEGAEERDQRYRELVARLAVEDVDWLGGLLRWLRGDVGLRSAALVGAVEAVRARLAAGAHGRSRRLVDSVLLRPDEPGEALAYWTGRYGRAVPKPLKRGVADAVARLYTERALLKYDTDARAYRFGDVIDIVHPVARDTRQGLLFRHALDRRHGRGDPVPDGLDTLRARAGLMALEVPERRAVLDRPDADEVLRRAGMTWEALAGWLQGPMDAAAWKAVLASMGSMARLRNLRNFDEAGLDDETARAVAARIADPEEVARSRQLPMRYLAAHRAAPSLRWGAALERALQASLANVPALPGRTLVLVDRSGSMFFGGSDRSTLTAADSAAVFGAALALRAEDADLVQFGTTHAPVGIRRGDALLRVVERFGNLGGTNTAAAVRDNYRGHDRVVIVTDEQAWAGRRGEDPTGEVPAQVPVYTWNLAGYRYGHGPSGEGGRYTFAGLTDAAFGMIPLIEAGRAARWPWERQA